MTATASYPTTSNLQLGWENSISTTKSFPSSVQSQTVVTREFKPQSVPRLFTVLKEVGDGSFGTVWLADWQSELIVSPGTLPPGPSSRPEYSGKKLVAIKRMKKAFEGGWEECLKLKELKSLRQIPMHPNIIPLYDAFLLPSTKELYFVFECMEGNLYQLTKSRKGRPLASGLTASIFYQILAGLHHIHQCGYFHRDMKPENLLITTTGLADYPASSLYAPPGATTEKDVVVMVKLADFGLARETNSNAAILTEYVSTRWYRAPEVLLRSRDYSNPVDMWALGTILVEVITLKPLFPGDSEVDQVYKICEVLGDPSPEYGIDERRRVKGGGAWVRGVKMAKEVGFAFPKMVPRNLSSLFDANTVPSQLVDCIADLLRYEPKARLTTQQCLDHPYFREVAYRFAPLADRLGASHPGMPARQPSNFSTHSLTSPANQSPRVLPTSHANGTPIYHKPAFATSGLPPALDSPQWTPNGHYSPNPSSISVASTYATPMQPPTSEDSAMQFQENQRLQAQNSPQDSIWSGHHVESHWGRLPADQESLDDVYRPIPAFGTHQGRRGSFSGSVAASTFYDGSIFEGIAPSRASSIMSFPIGYGGQGAHYSDELSRQLERNGLQNSQASNSRSPQRVNGVELPSYTTPVEPAPQPSGSKSRSWGFSSVFRPDATPSALSVPPLNSLNRTMSGSSTYNGISGSGDMDSPRSTPLDPKKAKKEAERLAKEAEKVKREAIQMVARERARAVMRKKNQLMEAADPLNNYSNQLRAPVLDKGKARAPGSTTSLVSTPHGSRMPQIIEDTSRLHVSMMRHKTRRRDDDDDVHSVSSGDTGHSSQRSQRNGRPFSVSSQATSASEPDVRPRQRSHNGLSRVTSLSSIGSSATTHSHSHTKYRAPSTGHSSLDHQLIDDFSGLATSGDDGRSPVRSESRGHRHSPSPRELPETRFSPYPPFHSNRATNGHTLPAIDHSGHLRHPSAPQSSSASIASYHSTPGSLPSHYDLPFLPSMIDDSEGTDGRPSTTFPYSNQVKP